MPTKTIVCLANSFRPGGSCVAGIEIIQGQFDGWIRPISHRADQAINYAEKTLDDGSSLSVLDIIEIAFDEHRPEHHQTENWLITEGSRWRKVGQMAPSDLLPAVLPSTTRLWRPTSSTYTGQNDEVPAFFARRLANSLALVRPTAATIDVSFNPHGNKNEVWVSFGWAGTQHKMKLTDPIQFARFNTAVGARHTLNHPFLCISLAHVWEQRGTASKLVAGLIE
ncbi:MAG: dual OB domain-containing protein [Verrucomicrobiota bacterium]